MPYVTLGQQSLSFFLADLRRQQQPAPEPATEDHVKAPPDLIDDDVTKPDPNATPAASPQPGTPASKTIKPERDGKPKPAMNPRDLAYLRAAYARNLAQQKKKGGS